MQDMRKFSKKSLCLAATALFLTAGISAGTAMAYFTTYAEASGSLKLEMGFTETVPSEEFIDKTKHVTIKNTGNYDCFVRVKALAGEKYQEGLVYIDPKEKWNPDGEYYVYKEPLAPGETTSELNIKIKCEATDANFNVIVVQESTKVLYDENNKPYADWSQIADTSETTGE